MPLRPPAALLLALVAMLLSVSAAGAAALSTTRPSWLRPARHARPPARSLPQTGLSVPLELGLATVLLMAGAGLGRTRTAHR